MGGGGVEEGRCWSGVCVGDGSSGGKGIEGGVSIEAQVLGGRKKGREADDGSGVRGSGGGVGGVMPKEVLLLLGEIWRVPSPGKCIVLCINSYDGAVRVFMSL